MEGRNLTRVLKVTENVITLDRNWFKSGNKLYNSKYIITILHNPIYIGLEQVETEYYYLLDNKNNLFVSPEIGDILTE